MIFLDNQIALPMTIDYSTFTSIQTGARVSRVSVSQTAFSLNNLMPKKSGSGLLGSYQDSTIYFGRFCLGHLYPAYQQGLALEVYSDVQGLKLSELFLWRVRLEVAIFVLPEAKFSLFVATEVIA